MNYYRECTTTSTAIGSVGSDLQPDGYNFTDYGIQWSVLGVLRLWYTFCEGDIVSKTDAGRYALDRLPARWHRLIQVAIDLRDNPERGYYKSRICRAVDAVQFLRYIIRLCDRQVLTKRV